MDDATQIRMSVNIAVQAILCNIAADRSLLVKLAFNGRVNFDNLRHVINLMESVAETHANQSNRTPSMDYGVDDSKADMSD